MKIVLFLDARQIGRVETTVERLVWKTGNEVMRRVGIVWERVSHGEDLLRHTLDYLRVNR